MNTIAEILWNITQGFVRVALFCLFLSLFAALVAGAGYALKSAGAVDTVSTGAVLTVSTVLALWFLYIIGLVSSDGW